MLSSLIKHLPHFLKQPTVVLTVAAVFLMAGGATANVLDASQKGAVHDVATKKTGEADGGVSGLTTQGSVQGESDSVATAPNSEPGTGGAGTASNSSRWAGIPKKSLKFSPSSVVLPKNGNGVGVEVWAEDGTAIPWPGVSDAPGLLVSVSDHALAVNMDGGVYTQKKWGIYIGRVGMDTSGSAYVSASVYSNGNLYEGTVKVTWSPVPSFYVEQAGLTRTDDGTKVTYAMTFRLVPNHPHFGKPTIYARILGGSDDNSGPCDEGIQALTFQYNGQNEYTMTCVYIKPPPYVPGTGPPPPLVQQGFAAKISIYGMLNGEFIHGGTGEYFPAYHMGGVPLY